MPIITILDKLYGSYSPTTLEKIYSNLMNGLKVQLGFRGTTDRGWIQLDVSGADEIAALYLLDREIGLAPESLVYLQKFSVMQGKIIFSNTSTNRLYVDLGASSPNICDAVLSDKSLYAQLTDGKEISHKELVRLFCFYDYFPIQVKLFEDITTGNESVNARLSESQLSFFKKCIRSRFDRLIILGSLISDVQRAVKLSRHYRDIIRIESLGTLEQVILCKLGTDAVGLIPKIGRSLKTAVLVPFSPKKIIEKLGGDSFDW